MIPKGVIDLGKEPLAAARREFTEETGLSAPTIVQPLTAVRQAGGKQVFCWSAEMDLDLAGFKPGQFEMEWPPRSGHRQAFPELDRVAYFEGSEALRRILPSQAPLIDQVLLRLGERG